MTVTAAIITAAINGNIRLHSDILYSFIIFRSGGKMQTKRFTKNDDSFICLNCGYEVPPLGYTSRNHCPKCLWSAHVDELPGDRASECGGSLEPVSAVTDPKKGYIIIHRCKKCGAIRRNKAARDDDINLIIKLTAKQVETP